MFFPKHSEIESTWPVNSSKEDIVLSRDSRELFAQRFVKVFDQNWKYVQIVREIKEQAPQLTFFVPW